MKNSTNIQDFAAQRESGSNHFGPRRVRSEDAEAMEDPLNVGDVVGELGRALDLEIAWPWEIDVDDAVDPARPRRHHADAARKLHCFLDRMGDEDHGRFL